MCVLYFFHTSWCTKCKSFDEKFSNTPSPYVVNVDAETCPAVMLNTYRISMLPTFVLVERETDKEIDRLESPSSFEELCDWFKLKTGKDILGKC